MDNELLVGIGEEELQIVSKYQALKAQLEELEPEYKLVETTIKNNMLETGKKADTIDLPDGAKFVLTRRAGYIKEQVNKDGLALLKTEVPNYERYVSTVTYQDSCIVKYAK